MIKVLVVEDVAEMRELLLELLRGIPRVSRSSAVGNCMEARLEIDRHRPDLVLLDEVLPGESSLDLLEDLQRRGVPVILLTGMATEGRPLPPGALARFLKPTWETLDLDRQRFSDEIPVALSLQSC